MTKWCFLLVIVCVVDIAHQFPTNEKELRRGSSGEKIYDGPVFKLCQNILNQITERLRHEVDIYKLLQERGIRANYWLFGEEIAIGKNWCMSEKSHVVHFSWNPDWQLDCVDLTIIDGTLNFTEYICDISALQRGLAEPTLDYEMLMEKNARPKRSANTNLISAYINIAKEIEITDCSKPTLNVYLNKKLVFSNASRVVSNYTPIDTIEVHINVDSTAFTNFLPDEREKSFFISSYTRNYFDAKLDCYNRSMRLLSIKSGKEHVDVIAAIKNGIEQSTFWTSAIESEKKKSYSTWHWSDGDTITYMNWISGEPNNPDNMESCVAIIGQGLWIDLDCKAEERFICESVLDQTPVKIFVDENVIYESFPGYENNRGNNQHLLDVVEVKLVLNDTSNNHFAKFQLLKKHSPQEEPFEQRLVFPEYCKSMNFNGTDIRIEIIKEKGLFCHKDKTYHVHTEEKLDYENAREFCKNRSTQLVSIQNEWEQSDIEELLLKLNIDHYYWTSGYLAENGSTWLWNGNEAITYFNWATREPNNVGGNEKCIEIFVPWQTAKWNDQECQDKNHVICESFLEPYWIQEPQEM